MASLPNIQTHHIQAVTITNSKFTIQEDPDELAPASRFSSQPSYPRADDLSFIVHTPSHPHELAIFIAEEDLHPPSLDPSFSSFLSLIQYAPVPPLCIHRRAPNSVQVNTRDLESGEGEDTRRHIWEIFDKQELGKHVLGFAIPMVISTVLSDSSLSSTIEMRVMTVVVSCSIAAIWNGLLFRKTCRKLTSIILATGAALMMLSFFVLISCYAPRELKWVFWLAWIATLFPFILPLLFHRKSTAINHPERGRRPYDR